MPQRKQRPYVWPASQRPERGTYVDAGRSNPKFGNPFRDGDRDTQIARHRDWVLDPDGGPITYITPKGRPRTFQHPTVEDIQANRGLDWYCYCGPGEPCHADVLLALANQPTKESA